jgi:hypothetical protein
MYYSYVEIEYVAMSFSPAKTDLALKLLINGGWISNGDVHGFFFFGVVNEFNYDSDVNELGKGKLMMFMNVNE